MLKKAIEGGETCLKKIVRVKNMFSQNHKKFLRRNIGKNPETNLEWLYSYADIKMLILIETDSHNMVVECQFLLNFMSKAKSLGVWYI